MGRWFQGDTDDQPGRVVEPDMGLVLVYRLDTFLVKAPHPVQDTLDFCHVDGRVAVFKFTSREWDSEIGQYFYRARDYAPNTGRFLSEDPAGFAAGDSNVYRYAFNQPTGFDDPSGLGWPFNGQGLTQGWNNLVQGYQGYMRAQHNEMMANGLASMSYNKLMLWINPPPQPSTPDPGGNPYTLQNLVVLGLMTGIVQETRPINPPGWMIPGKLKPPINPTAQPKPKPWGTWGFAGGALALGLWGFGVSTGILPAEWFTWLLPWEGGGGGGGPTDPIDPKPREKKCVLDGLKDGHCLYECEDGSTWVTHEPPCPQVIPLPSG